MSHARSETCATCTAFPLERAAEGDGTATCKWFGRLYAWNEKFCVLYERDRPNLRTRGRWIEIILEKEKHARDQEAPPAG